MPLHLPSPGQVPRAAPLCSAGEDWGVAAEGIPLAGALPLWTSEAGVARRIRSVSCRSAATISLTKRMGVGYVAEKAGCECGGDGDAEEEPELRERTRFEGRGTWRVLR